MGCLGFFVLNGPGREKTKAKYVLNQRETFLVFCVCVWWMHTDHNDHHDDDYEDGAKSEGPVIFVAGFTRSSSISSSVCIITARFHHPCFEVHVACHLFGVSFTMFW